MTTVNPPQRTTHRKFSIDIDTDIDIDIDILTALTSGQSDSSDQSTSECRNEGCSFSAIIPREGHALGGLSRYLFLPLSMSTKFLPWSKWLSAMIPLAPNRHWMPFWWLTCREKASTSIGGVLFLEAPPKQKFADFHVRSSAQMQNRQRTASHRGPTIKTPTQHIPLPRRCWITASGSINTPEELYLLYLHTGPAHRKEHTIEHGTAQRGERRTSVMKKFSSLVLKNGRSSATKSPVSGGVFHPAGTPVCR